MRSACWRAPIAPPPNGGSRASAASPHGCRLGTAAGALGRRDRRGAAAAAGMGRHRRRPARAAPRRTVAKPRVLARFRSGKRARRGVPCGSDLFRRCWRLAAASGGASRAAASAPSSPPSTPNARTIAVVPAAFTADATRVPELWLIPADGKPRPLGLLQRRPHGDHYHPAAIRRPDRQQCRAGGVTGAARRFADRIADRPGDRHRQAHEPVSAILHP